MRARIDLLRQVVEQQPRPSGRRDSHNWSLPEIGEGAGSASLGRWIHVAVQDGEAAESALEAERRNLVAFLMEYSVLSLTVLINGKRDVALAD